MLAVVDEDVVLGDAVMFSRLVAESVVSKLTSLSNFAFSVVRVAASANTLA